VEVALCPWEHQDDLRVMAGRRVWDAPLHVVGKVPPVVPGVAESLSLQGTRLLKNFSIQ